MCVYTKCVALVKLHVSFDPDSRVKLCQYENVNPLNLAFLDLYTRLIFRSNINLNNNNEMPHNSVVVEKSHVFLLSSFPPTVYFGLANFCNLIPRPC